MTDHEFQPRSLDEVPRGVWLGASALLGAPQPNTSTPHICGIEIQATTTHGTTVDVKYWQRDCPGCWDAGWRPKTWEASLAKARQAAMDRHLLEAQIEETGGEIGTAFPEPPTTKNGKDSQE